MRRVLILTFVLIVLGGCTAILGTFDVPAPATEAGTEGGLIVADGSVVGDAGGIPLDAFAPLNADAGTGTCGIAAPITVATGTLASLVRIYHTPGGARIVDLSSDDTTLSVYDVAGATAPSGPTAKLTVAGLLNLRHIDNGLTVLSLSTDSTPKLEISRLPDGQTAFDNSTDPTFFVASSVSSGNIVPTTADASAESPSFLALGDKSTETLYVANQDTAAVHSIYADAAAGDPFATTVLTVLDDSQKAYIFTSGNIADNLQPTVFATKDTVVVTPVNSSPVTLLGPGMELIDVSGIVAGSLYGATGVSVLKDGTGNITYRLLAQTFPSVTSLATATGLDTAYTFGSAEDIPWNGDSRWESAAGLSMLVLAGGVPPQMGQTTPAATGLNLIWYDASNKVNLENFTEGNRLATNYSIYAASAAVSTSGNNAWTVDVAYVTPVGTSLSLIYQQMACTFPN